MGDGEPMGTHLPWSGTKVHFAYIPCFLLFSLLSFGDPWIPSRIERPNVYSFCQVPCPALPCKPCLLLCYSRRNPVLALSQPCVHLSECRAFSGGNNCWGACLLLPLLPDNTRLHYRRHQQGLRKWQLESLWAVIELGKRLWLGPSQEVLTFLFWLSKGACLSEA